MKYLFVECGCCGGYHAPDFAGDCREDAHRYTTPRENDNDTD